MKYCAKCGNPMDDDMMFCQKCGTRFEGTVELTLSDTKIKLDKMKKYDLVLDSRTITWDYLRTDGERAGKITLKQDQLCVELAELIKDILETTSDEERDMVEREVYTYVLKMGYRMCKEGEKLFSDYSGFKQLFDQGHDLVLKGYLDAGTFLGQMQEQDYVYKVIAGLQSLHCSRLKEVLDETVIYNNLEYRELTKLLAQAFNDMWVKCIKRYTDFFLSPGEGYINQNWEIYNILLKGLPMSIVDTLDEDGWRLALDDWEKNHNGKKYKYDFIQKREKQRDEKRKEEQEIEDNKYWILHPKEFVQFQDNKKKMNEFQKDIEELDRAIHTMENERYVLVDRAKAIDSSVLEKKQRIQKLGKKVLGKKKAEEEIKLLNNEIENFIKELQMVNEKIKDAEAPIIEKKNRKSALRDEMLRLGQENKKLRNKA